MIILTPVEIGFIGFAIGIGFGVISTVASYYNGVTDGYGYAVDPGCPGYRKAGRYLFRYMKHRWKVLDPETLDPETGLPVKHHVVDMTETTKTLKAILEKAKNQHHVDDPTHTHTQEALSRICRGLMSIGARKQTSVKESALGLTVLKDETGLQDPIFPYMDFEPMMPMIDSIQNTAQARDDLLGLIHGAVLETTFINGRSIFLDSVELTVSPDHYTIRVVLQYLRPKPGP